MSTERPDLDAIEALLTAATPGPWLADLDIFDPDDHEIEACVSNADVRILFTSGTGYTYGEAPEVERAAAWAAAKASQQMTDARLIAAAPLALREVIAYARALEQDRLDAQLLCAQHGPAGSPPDGDPSDGIREMLGQIRELEVERNAALEERDYLQERVNDLNEQYAALERERDAAQARHDAEIAGIVA